MDTGGPDSGNMDTGGFNTGNMDAESPDKGIWFLEVQYREYGYWRFNIGNMDTGGSI